MCFKCHLYIKRLEERGDKKYCTKKVGVVVFISNEIN